MTVIPYFAHSPARDYKVSVCQQFAKEPHAYLGSHGESSLRSIVGYLILRGHVDETANGRNKDNLFVELDSIFSGSLSSLVFGNGSWKTEPMPSECASEEQRGNKVNVKHPAQIGCRALILGLYYNGHHSLSFMSIISTH